RIDHDDVVAGVEVRCIDRLVLAGEAHRHGRSETTQRLPFGVHDPPVSLDLGAARYVGSHDPLLCRRRAVRAHPPIPVPLSRDGNAVFTTDGAGSQPFAGRHPIRRTITAFWAWRRFSACWKITEAGESATMSVTSSPRWAGRQCMKTASSPARDMRPV